MNSLPGSSAPPLAGPFVTNLLQLLSLRRVRISQGRVNSCRSGRKGWSHMLSSKTGTVTLSCLAAAGLFVSAASLVAQAPPGKPRADRGKEVVEASPKVILAGGLSGYTAPSGGYAAAPVGKAVLKGAAPLVTPKGRIENPTKAILAKLAATPARTET